MSGRQGAQGQRFADAPPLLQPHSRATHRLRSADNQCMCWTSSLHCLQVLVFPIPLPIPAFVLGIGWVASDISGSIRVRLISPDAFHDSFLQVCKIPML